MGEEGQFDFMVCVECMTFNQSAYIRQTMDGFSIQKTSFPFVCLIVDDASIDGEQQVIKQYLLENFEKTDLNPKDTDDYRQFFLQHKTNTNCYFCVLFLKYNHYLKKSKDPYIAKWRHKSKYVAICEGDDYWTHPQKLQMQVEFMENHSEYSLCFTDVQNYDEENRKLLKRQSKKYSKYNKQLEEKGKSAFYDILLGRCRIQTLSVLFRSKEYLSRPKDPVIFKMGDTQLWLYFSQIGKIKYLDVCTGIYRIQPKSVTHNNRFIFHFSMFEMRLFYCGRYNYKVPSVIKRQYNKSLVRLAMFHIDIGRLPLYEMFPMNCLQNYFYRRMINDGRYRNLIHIMWLFERFETKALFFLREILF